MDRFINSLCLCALLSISMTQARPGDLSESLTGLGANLEICGNGRPADVVFLLDASNSIWNPDFRRQLKFVQAVVDYFPVGPNNIQVGVATFSSGVYRQFPLSRYTSKEQIMEGITDIRQEQGSYTRTYDAIKALREEFLQKQSGARDGVFKVGIVITDGRSYDTELTVKEAQLAKEEGIHMFAIGVGDYVDMNELRAIASEPIEHYTFKVDSYKGLQQIIDLLSIKVCTVTDPPTPAPITTTTTARRFPELKFETSPAPVYALASTRSPFEELRHGPIDTGVFPPEEDMGSNGRRFFEIDGCIPNQPMDLTFVIDSKQGGSAYTKKIWKFVKNTLDNLDLKNGDIKVRFVHDCLRVPSLHLARHAGHKAQLLSRIESMRVPTHSTPDLVRLMTRQLTQGTTPATNNGAASYNNGAASYNNGAAGFNNYINGAASYDNGAAGFSNNLNGAAAVGTDAELYSNAILPRHKVGVFVTDGASGDLEATLREAQNAKLDHGIELFGVGVTGDVNDVEMKAMVSCPPEKHLLFVPNHHKLKDMHRSLARKLCLSGSS